MTEINLDHNRLNGTLPPEIGDLDQLRQLNISSSGLTGAIPREIGRLTQLESIYLDRNDLTGPIPHELGLLPRLRRIDFNQNDLSGEIPPSLLMSGSITHIFMHENNLAGPIPREFHARSQIAFLRLYSNQLDSEIPPNIGQLQNLQGLWIQNNQLTGEIPTSIGQLRDLIHLIASDNQLSGPIPNEVSELSRLIMLILDNNRLTGTIPKGLGDIKTLKRLEIAGNDFTGCIPNNLRGVEESNINFANIPVCGEADRSEPSIPTYIQMEFGDTTSAAETLAAQLAVQEVSILLTDIGWPTPENTITIYVADQQGLALNYSNYVEGCDLACGNRTIDDRHATAELGAAFVQSYGTHADGLEWLAGATARLVLSAILLEPSGGLRLQDLHRDHKWLTEGLTTLVSLLATAEALGKPLDDLRRSNADRANRQFEPLWDLEDDRSMYNYRLGARHPVGAAAVDLLASQVGLSKLTEFFATRNSNEDWRQTFQRVFNITVPDFYELFNQHRMDGFPHRDLPLVGDTNWP